MTIANLVRALERRGHRCSIWIDDPGRRLHGRRHRGRRPAGVVRAVRAPTSPTGPPATTGADVAVATGWQTVARVRALPAAGPRLPRPGPRAGVLRHQRAARLGDRLLHPRACTPSRPARWLAEVMGEAYNLPATSFDLGIDGERWRPQPEVARRDDVVVAYARSSTPAARGPRRARRARPSCTAAGRRRGLALRPRRPGGRRLPAPQPRRGARAAAGRRLRRGDRRARAVDDQLLARRPGDALLRPAVRGARRAERRQGLRPRRARRLRAARPATRSPTRCSACSTTPQLRARRAAQGAPLRTERTWDHAAEQVEAGLRAAIAFTRGGEG